MRQLLFLVLALAISVPAYAAFSGPGASNGGFTAQEANQAAMTVEQAKALPDDARVSLTGKIISKLPNDDDKYIFRDGTGEIVVDIDDEDFRGQTVTPANTVRIHGEVDKHFARAPEIDVEMLEVIQ